MNNEGKIKTVKIGFVCKKFFFRSVNNKAGSNLSPKNKAVIPNHTNGFATISEKTSEVLSK